MKHGLVIENRLLCDPVTDDALLIDIIARQGFPVEHLKISGATILELAGRKLHILPGIEKRTSAPAVVGYFPRWTPWQIDHDNQQLVRSTDYQHSTFTDSLNQLQQHIATQQDAALSRIEHGYTTQEVKTWAQQQAEAAAWLADNSAVVPLLQGLAERRGVPLAIVVEKIHAKVTQAAQLTGIVLGDAQAAADQIAILQALDDTDQLPDDWFERLQVIATGWRKDWPSVLTDAI